MNTNIFINYANQTCMISQDVFVCTSSVPPPPKKKKSLDSSLELKFFWDAGSMFLYEKMQSVLEKVSTN